jgi:glyoxylase-like metal-dependent hydrolase (beta-lactamase superfamily II)
MADEMRPVQCFETDAGARVYQIPLEAFPGLWAYVYVVLLNDEKGETFRVLIDAGSGFGDSNQHLERGLQQISEMESKPLSLSDLTHIFITHGHIDHIGGLSYVRSRTGALLGVHELDKRNLTNYEERVVIMTCKLSQFLAEAGVPSEQRKDLLDLYKMTKSLFHSVPVDFTYEQIGMKLGPFRFLHVPGHCAGHVVVRLDGLLFSGDHVLSGISPHQAPEHLTSFTGLEHYLNSLDILDKWAADVRLTLGGHRRPITDLKSRLEEIRQVHASRLEMVLSLLGEPHTIHEVAQSLFGEVNGYNILLALEEAGAHVEYLYQRGYLGIENLSELEESDCPIPVYYQRLEGDPSPVLPSGDRKA